MMCPEERRRRNIKTCCVSLEMAVADMMYFFFSFERELCFCVSLERDLCFFFFCFSVFFFFFLGSDSGNHVRKMSLQKFVRE